MSCIIVCLCAAGKMVRVARAQDVPRTHGGHVGQGGTEARHPPESCIGKYTPNGAIIRKGLDSRGLTHTARFLYHSLLHSSSLFYIVFRYKQISPPQKNVCIYIYIPQIALALEGFLLRI